MKMLNTLLVVAVLFACALIFDVSEPPSVSANAVNVVPAAAEPKTAWWKLW